MANRQDDLDLLLSLQDRVLETPPHSPHYLSDEEVSPSRKVQPDLSEFRETVRDCLDYDPTPVGKNTLKSKTTKVSNESEVERFSGLRIRNQLVTSTELRGRFSDIRFVRLSTIKNVLVGDSLSGCWATIGVLTEKGIQRTSSTGKDYCIWKIGCLDEATVSLFLFGDAYKSFCNEKAGTAFALFNCTVRKDSNGSGFSLSIYAPKQVLKIGTSIDYAVCNGKRSDGMACTAVINRRQGVYCKFHKSRESQKYTTMRTELKGGNIRTAFRDPLNREGIYMVDPLNDKTNPKKATQPLKLLSVEGLKKALSNAGKVTTNRHSQGMRFLAEMTGITEAKTLKKESTIQNQQKTTVEKRKSSSLANESSDSQQLNVKKLNKIRHEQSLADKTHQGTQKMIELEYISSDEEI